MKRWLCVLMFLSGCSAQGHTEYQRPGSMCFDEGATGVTADGRDVECARDSKGDLSWLLVAP